MILPPQRRTGGADQILDWFSAEPAQILARCCLFLDVDGTLIEFQADPVDAMADATLIELLQRAADRFDGALALVSGRLLATLDPFVHKHAVKNDTLNILLNAGELRNVIADLALANDVVCVGSSANVSLSGTKYRLEDVDPELRAIADVETDYGLCAHHNPQGLSSTMIDFRDFRVQRAGACFERIADVMQKEFGIELQRPN